MTPTIATSLTLMFLAMALLAALVASLEARRRGLEPPAALRIGALLFLGQLALFVLGTALGVPSTAARVIALALGTVGALPQQGPERS